MLYDWNDKIELSKDDVIDILFYSLERNGTNLWEEWDACKEITRRNRQAISKIKNMTWRWTAK